MRKILTILAILPLAAQCQGQWAKILLSNGDTMRVQIVRSSALDTTMYGICDTIYYYASKWRLDSIATAHTAAIASKQASGSYVSQSTTVNGHALSSNVTVTASDLSLGNITNTSDANKPVSTAQQTALDLKANLASPTFTGTVAGITASMVGLGNVSNNAQLTIANNLSDLNNAGTARTNLGLGTLATQSGTFSGTTSGTNTGDQDLSSYATTAAVSSGYQPKDVDLTALAALTPDEGDFAAYWGGTWINWPLSSLVTTLNGGSITALGTVTTGTWHGSVIGSQYGGTGVNNSTRTLTVNTNSGTINFSASSKTLTVPLDASVSGTNTGDQTSVTGNAGTATALQNARTINGTSFDGTGNVTVTAAAGTLTGTTLNSSVVTSSLTSVGTLTSGSVAAITGGSIVANVSGSNFTTTNTTATDITGMSWAIGANETWEFTADLKVGSSSAAGIKIAVNTPASPTSLSAYVYGQVASNTAFAEEEITGDATLTTTAFNTGGLTTAAVGAFIHIRGIVVNGSNAGNVFIDIGKVTSGTATVYTLSHLKATKK